MKDALQEALLATAWAHQIVMACAQNQARSALATNHALPEAFAPVIRQAH